MLSRDLEFMPSGKYNNWCERRPLVADENAVFRTDKYVRDDSLSLSEKAAYYVHELVGCQGLEFVVFSNAYVKQPVTLSSGIKIVPCFLSEVNKSDTILGRLTQHMAHEGRFVYDGWLPIADWVKPKVRNAVRMIDSALSLFALRASAWFSWEPKYSPMSSAAIYYDFGQDDVEELYRLAGSIDKLEERDAMALLSSIGWLSQCVRLREPAARFLFGILAVESLATYIEEESSGASAFSNLRCEKLTKEEQKEQRQDCIRETIGKLLADDPEQAARTAYFDCVIGIRRRLQAHLTHVLPQESEGIDLLFNVKVDGKTLYEIRNEIAHGRMDAISEAQREQVLLRAWDMERISREYILEVIKKGVGISLSGNIITEGLSPRIMEGIVSDASMYHGPTHMAVVYSVPYGESLTLPEEPG